MTKNHKKYSSLKSLKSAGIVIGGRCASVSEIELRSEDELAVITTVPRRNNPYAFLHLCPYTVGPFWIKENGQQVRIKCGCGLLYEKESVAYSTTCVLPRQGRCVRSGKKFEPNYQAKCKHYRTEARRLEREAKRLNTSEAK